MYSTQKLTTLPKPNIGDISVNVTDGTDAISGASVVLTDADSDDTTKTTDSDGEAVFENVETGTYTLTVSKTDYATVTQTLVVTGDVTVDVELTPCRTVNITVDDGDSTDPQGISGATVVIDGDTENARTTGSSGGTAPKLPDGEHTIAVSKSGYQDKSVTITVDSTHTSFTISLEAEGG